MAEQNGKPGSTVVDPVEITSEEVNKQETTSLSSFSSSSDSETEKPVSPEPVKEKFHRLFGRERPLHRVLGGGKPADLFLWRNKKTTASALAGATAIYVLFEILEFHLLTLTCHVLIVLLSVLFLWSNVTTFLYKSPPRLPDLHLSEERFHQFVSSVVVQINRLFSLLRDIASGRDLKEFLIVIASLWVLSVAGDWFNFLTLLYTAFVVLCTVPILYEKYEDKVDSYAEKATTEIKRQYAVLDARVLSKIPRGPLKDKKQ